MPRHGSSSKGKQKAAEPKDWSWVTKNYPLHDPNLSNLITSWHHEDFRLSRGWLCLVQENIVDDVGTNHAYLKFDFKDCKNHNWRGFKLEATELPSEAMRDRRTGREYTAGVVNLGFKDWTGPPRGLRYFMELDTRFGNRAAGGTTLGAFIEIISRAGLLRFGFGTIRTCKGFELYIGCRDFVAQVLFSLYDENCITDGCKLKNQVGYKEIAELGPPGEWRRRSAGSLFPSIFAVLSCFFEEVRDHKGRWFVIPSSSPVQPGFLPDQPRRKQTPDGYPYFVPYPIGCRYDPAIHSRARAVQTEQGGFGGQGAYGQGSQPGPSMPGSSGHGYPRY